MPPFNDNTSEPDPFLPPEPQELPPLPNQSDAAFATGKDQGAGQARELGAAPAPPAYRTPEAIPPGAETATPYSIEPPATLHYSGYTPPSVSASKPMPPKPEKLPPVPRTRNPGRERRQRMQAAKRAKHLGAVGDGDLLAAAGAKKWNTKTSELNDDMLKMWEKASRLISVQQSQMGVILAILEDTRARQLETERALAAFTMPGVMPRGY